MQETILFVSFALTTSLGAVDLMANGAVRPAVELRLNVKHGMTIDERGPDQQIAGTTRDSTAGLTAPVRRADLK